MLTRTPQRSLLAANAAEASRSRSPAVGMRTTAKPSAPAGLSRRSTVRSASGPDAATNTVSRACSRRARRLSVSASSLSAASALATRSVQIKQPPSQPWESSNHVPRWAGDPLLDGIPSPRCTGSPTGRARPVRGAAGRYRVHPPVVDWSRPNQRRQSSGWLRLTMQSGQSTGTLCAPTTRSRRLSAGCRSWPAVDSTGWPGRSCQQGRAESPAASRASKTKRGRVDVGHSAPVVRGAFKASCKDRRGPPRCQPGLSTTIARCRAPGPSARAGSARLRHPPPPAGRRSGREGVQPGQHQRAPAALQQRLDLAHAAGRASSQDHAHAGPMLRVDHAAAG